MMRTNQRGSILGFVIVGGIMSLLLVGGAYIVRHTLAASNEAAQPTAVKETKDDTTKTQQSTGDTKKEPTSEAPAGEEPTLPGGTDSAPQSEPKDEAPADLPQTGPADTLLTGALLGGLVAATLAYKRSRDSISSL